MIGLLFPLAFAFYLSGLSGTVPSYRDSGDLIASIYTMGIAHPPGYALYILIGKLFVTLLPFGNAAYRVNVFSAFSAAGAAVVLLAFLRRVSGAPLAGALTVALLYATAPSTVALARVAEMYTLAAFFAGAILLCLVSDHPNGRFFAAFLLGLGLSVHATLIFLAPLFLTSEPRNETAASLTRRWGASALFFLLGLSVFLYLPLRAAQHPLLNWGDPSNWRNFWRVVTRADYGGLKLHPEQSSFSWTADSVGAQADYFAKALKEEWGWGACILGVIGIFAGLQSRQTRRLSLGLLASWVLSGPAFFLLANLPLREATTPAILQPYLLLSGLLWAPFVVLGIASVLSGLKKKIHLPAVGITAIVVILLGSRSWVFSSERNDFYTYDYARNLLKSLPPDAVLYDPDDPTHFSIQVLQTLENRRTDVALLNFFRTRWGYEEIKRRWPDLLPPVPITSGQELERLLWTYSARRRPFFAELPQKFSGLSIPYRAEGLVYRASPPASEAWARAEALLQVYVTRGDLVATHHADFFTRHLVDYYAAAHCNLGLDYANAGKWEKAVEHYRAALAIDPDLSAAYNDWGIVAFERADYAQASDLFHKGLESDPENENLRKNAELALQKMRKLI